MTPFPYFQRAQILTPIHAVSPQKARPKSVNPFTTSGGVFGWRKPQAQQMAVKMMNPMNAETNCTNAIIGEGYHCG